MRSSSLVAAVLSGCSIGAASGQSAAGTERTPSQLGSAPGVEVFPPYATRDLVIRACAPCHVPELVVAKRRTAEEWDRIILAMVDRGADATEDEQLQILEYLLHFFGPATEGASE